MVMVMVMMSMMVMMFAFGAQINGQIASSGHFDDLVGVLWLRVMGW